MRGTRSGNGGYILYQLKLNILILFGIVRLLFSLLGKIILFQRDNNDDDNYSKRLKQQKQQSYSNVNNFNNVSVINDNDNDNDDFNNNYNSSSSLFKTNKNIQY